MGQADGLELSQSASQRHRLETEMGRILAIRGEGKQIAERLHIHHNYFYNFPDQGGANGAETFQFGLSGFSLSTSNSTSRQL